MYLNTKTKGRIWEPYWEEFGNLTASKSITFIRSGILGVAYGIFRRMMALGSMLQCLRSERQVAES
jgi:hypothetical protein